MAKHASDGKRERLRPQAGGVALADKPARGAVRTSLPAPSIDWNSGSNNENWCRRFGMDERSVALRRQFIRLGIEEQQLLGEMAPWAQSVAAEIAKDFYDWQFEFGPTREFFENFARERQMGLGSLRQALESAQAKYFTELFAGASIGWDLRYFEKRLTVGAAHDRINLPFKWYVGAYSEYYRLLDAYLRRDFDDLDKINRVAAAVDKVMNLDLQAIGDSFMLSTMQSILAAMGVDLDAVGIAGDKSGQLSRVKEFIVGQFTKFTGELNHMSEEHRQGDIDARIPEESLHGTFKTVAQGVNGMVGEHVAVKRKIMHSILEFAQGNFDAELEQFTGKRSYINDGLEELRKNLKALLGDVDVLIQASREGKLDTRADAAKHRGGFATAVSGINQMLDAILLPIGEGNRVLAQISNGKVDELITQTYQGDHEKMKNAVNNVAVVLQGLQKQLNQLTEASKEGQLSQRGKPEQFQGAYAEIVKGVNEMLDAILLPIGEGNRVLAQISSGNVDELITQTYRGDHEKMKQAVNNVAIVLQGLERELSRLIEASKDGRLSERGKAEQFQGAYAEIVKGVNEMLDAILLPIGEGNRILGLVRGGNLRERVEIACKGDHEKMKNAINGVHAWLTELIGLRDQNRERRYGGVHVQSLRPGPDS